MKRRCKSTKVPIGTGFTTFSVRDGAPVTLVIHDKEGTWQFIGEEDPSVERGCIIHADHIFMRPGMLQLMDLPLGASAERKSVNDPWVWSSK